MSKKKVAITKVEVQMGKEAVEITVEQARELKKALDELFGPTVREEHHHHHGRPYYRPYVWYTGTQYLPASGSDWNSQTGSRIVWSANATGATASLTI